MHRIVYSSIASKGTNTPDVFEIVDVSARNNPQRSVTGFLLYDADRFLQMIEGPALALQALLEDLEADPRHHSIEVLHRSATDERWFPDWEMKQLISFSAEPALEQLRHTLATKPGGAEIFAIVDDFLRE
ncbi:BLUF domain-containing protein [Qipengyuania seohaensis]|uniref:BLUF domain-containing protein n=1 Tax=Qipengyuania seohaensis TaxID=266951 RepID=UPI000C229BC1|nr:BLUF domain-containing protein [Qipengyuania seohaensis]